MLRPLQRLTNQCSLIPYYVFIQADENVNRFILTYLKKFLRRSFQKKKIKQKLHHQVAEAIEAESVQKLPLPHP